MNTSISSIYKSSLSKRSRPANEVEESPVNENPSQTSKENSKILKSNDSQKSLVASQSQKKKKKLDTEKDDNISDKTLKVFYFLFWNWIYY